MSHTFLFLALTLPAPDSTRVQAILMNLGGMKFPVSASSSSTGSWSKNFDISRMVYGITIRLAGMKPLAVTKQQLANCVDSSRETDAAVRYPSLVPRRGGGGEERLVHTVCACA